MWRWLHSLPRAVRHQFYPTGASAGVCENECRVRKDSPESAERNQNYGGKDQCKAGHHRYHGWKHRFGQSNFWRMVQGPCSSYDTLKYGPVVTVGLQSGHVNACHGTKDPEEGKKHCLYYRVAAALPTWNDIAGSLGKHILTQAGTRKQIKDNNDKKTETKSNHPEVETLEAAFSNFERVCRKYTAVGKGIMASQAVQEGQMNSAVGLWHESSGLGYGKSQFNLAVCYETGQGVEKNMSKAIQYYLKAAEDEHAMAMYNLALLYIEGLESEPGDTDRAITLLTRAADLGLAEAQKYLGVYYSDDDKDTAKSFYYLTKAAEQNDAEAQYLLGICYECGCGIQENTCKAAHWYTRSAQGGNADAMYSLAVFHKNGFGGLPENHKSARTMFQKAADIGHDESRNELKKMDEEKVALDKISTSTPDQSDVGLFLKINSCVSAPCLTDLVREDISPPGKPVLYDPISQLGTLSHIFSQLMVPRALTDFPSLNEIQKKRGSVSDDDSGSDSGVSFKLGDYEEDEEDKIDRFSSVGNFTSHEWHSLHRKNSTMPDLQATACK